MIHCLYLPIIYKRFFINYRLKSTFYQDGGKSFLFLFWVNIVNTYFYIALWLSRTIFHFFSGQDFSNRVGTIVGWGRVGVEKTSSKFLLKASLRILTDDECTKSKLSQHLKPSMMCAFSKGKDGCQVSIILLETGDSLGDLLSIYDLQIHQTRVTKVCNTKTRLL